MPKLIDIDPRLTELAQSFLHDEPALHEHVNELATFLQETIEDWIEETKEELESEDSA